MTPSPELAVAVDLGSTTAGVWAARHGVVSGPTGETAVQRGRVADVDGCATVLTRLVSRYPNTMPSADLLVACRPVLTTEADEALMRRVLDTAFAPRRIVFIDSVRAAAIGSGATAGTLLIADIGARVTEVALLDHGRVTEARRTGIGTRDLDSRATIDLISDVVAGHVRDLRETCPGDDFEEAADRGLLLVGDGASHPGLATALSDAVHLQVHRAASPHTAALNGARIAAVSALRHPSRRR
ncbi:rod shape-determining protein [Actinoplanes sp. G11-F43]|uniref:rod shape-determining protein n=1 Tax=Actinoplanes sp. G11-F43 TaxID=3424130 RepID=UPI003D336908